MRNTARKNPLVIGCGALAPELVELTRRAGLPAMDLTCLPASLHNRPERIPGAVAARIRRARKDGYDRIFVAYADCGTGGLLDPVLEAEGVARLEGAHCYEVYAGRAAFATLHDEEPGTFYLTDYLVRNFDRLVIRGLGLDRHPELRAIYFGNYRRLVYLAQADDAALTAKAEAGATRLELAFERRLVGLGELASSIGKFAMGGASSTDGRASDAHSERPSGLSAPDSVETGHRMEDSIGSGRGDAPFVHRTNHRHANQQISVRNVHRMHAAARAGHRMHAAARAGHRMHAAAGAGHRMHAAGGAGHPTLASGRRRAAA